jgi:hypothetical protein
VRPLDITMVDAMAILKRIALDRPPLFAAPI